MFDGDIKITGKHATYIKFLASKSVQLNKNIPCAGVFKRYIDVYIAGITIGLVKNLKDNGNKWAGVINEYLPPISLGIAKDL